MRGTLHRWSIRTHAVKTLVTEAAEEFVRLNSLISGNMARIPCETCRQRVNGVHEEIKRLKEKKVEYSGWTGPTKHNVHLTSKRCIVADGSILEAGSLEKYHKAMELAVKVHREMVEFLNEILMRATTTCPPDCLLIEAIDRLAWAQKKADQCEHEKPMAIAVRYDVD
jgi:hypothetical protein